MRKGMFVCGAAVAALAVTATSVTAAVAGSRPAPGPDGVTVQVVSVNGSGCPVGTVSVSLKDGRDAFAITYSDYVAQTGGSSRPYDVRKNCQVRLKVNVPQGFTYAVSQVIYYGYAYLQPGASALQKGNYYLQGSNQLRVSSNEVKGPYDDDWHSTDTTPAHQLVWKPCDEDRDLNINTELRLDKGTSDPSKINFVTMDPAGDGPQTIYHFAWKECP